MNEIFNGLKTRNEKEELNCHLEMEGNWEGFLVLSGS